jgi:hypothetical protein
MVRDPGSHGGRNAQRFVDPTEVVKRKPARDSGPVVGVVGDHWLSERCQLSTMVRQDVVTHRFAKRPKSAAEIFHALACPIPFASYIRAQIMSANDTETWRWQLPDVKEGETICFRVIEAHPALVWCRTPIRPAERP